MLRSPILAAQHFAGSPLVRGGVGRKLDGILSGLSGEQAAFCLVADRRLAVTGGSGGGGPDGVRWLDRAGKSALL